MVRTDLVYQKQTMRRPCSGRSIFVSLSGWPGDVDGTKSFEQLKIQIISGGSRNSRGRGVGLYLIFGFRRLCWCPSHIRYVFVARAENKLHIANTFMLTTVKVYAWYEVKIYKNKLPPKIQTRGASVRCADPGSAFVYQGWNIMVQRFCNKGENGFQVHVKSLWKGDYGS